MVTIRLDVDKKVFKVTFIPLKEMSARKRNYIFLEEYSSNRLSVDGLSHRFEI